MNNKKNIIFITLGVVAFVVVVSLVYSFSSGPRDHRVGVEPAEQYIRIDNVTITTNEYADACFGVSYRKSRTDCYDEWDGLSMEELFARYNMYVQVLEDPDRPSDSKPVMEAPFDKWDEEGSYTNMQVSYAIANATKTEYIWGDQYVDACNNFDGYDSEYCINEWNTEESETLALYYATYIAMDDIVN